MAKEIIAKEEMEQETETEVTETAEKTKKGLPGWAKTGLAFLGGAAASAILIGLFGHDVETEDDRDVKLSDGDYRDCGSSNADSDE